MPYSSHLNMGLAYDNESNFFNAIRAYQTSISKENYPIKAINNVGVSLQSLGMQREALKCFNRAINIYEERNDKAGYDAWKYYTNRARLLRLSGNYKGMHEDIQKSFLLKSNNPYSWFEIGKFQLLRNDVKLAEQAYTNAVDANPNSEFVWIERGNFFKTIGNHKRAIDDFIKAEQVCRESDLYDDFNDLDGNSKPISIEEQIREQYLKPTYSSGVVLSVNSEDKSGFLLGKTFFNDYGRIYFDFTQCSQIPDVGERVTFQNEYTFRNGEFVCLAKNVNVSNIEFESHLKEEKVHHALISKGSNAFKATFECKYVEVFYPVRVFLNYSVISEVLEDSINKELARFGFAFIECLLKRNNQGQLTLDCIKSISADNTYSNKSVSSRRNKYDEYSSDRTCSVCGMDEWCGSDGCPWDAN